MIRARSRRWAGRAALTALLALWCGDRGWPSKPEPLPPSGASTVPVAAAFFGGPAASGPAPGGRCTDPDPPPVSGFSFGVRLAGGGEVTIDSTAIVGPDVLYCASIGFTDMRSLCPVRLAGDPEREPCEARAVGRARDTGRYGPTWTADGQYCRGLAVNGCANHPDDQYKLLVSRPGTYVMCAANGACGEQRVDR